MMNLELNPIENLMPDYINKTEQALLDRLEELRIELESCQDFKQRTEIQKTIDENFLTLGMFYKTYLYGNKNGKIHHDDCKFNTYIDK